MNAAARKRVERKVIIILLVVALTLILVGCSQTADYKTSVYVLFDFSKTYYKESTKGQIESVLKTVNTAIIKLAHVSEMPIKISFLAITDQSLSANAIAISLYQRKIFAGKKKDLITKPRDLKNFLEVCAQSILSTTGSDYTDISGAINLATRMNTGQKQGEKSILILSDMKEETRAGTQKSSFDLAGYNVLILYRILGEDARNPNQLARRLEEWAQRLTDAGAKKVGRLHDSIKDVNQIVGGLQN